MELRGPQHYLIHLPSGGLLDLGRAGRVAVNAAQAAWVRERQGAGYLRSVRIVESKGAEGDAGPPPAAEQQEAAPAGDGAGSAQDLLDSSGGAAGTDAEQAETPEPRRRAGVGARRETPRRSGRKDDSA